MATEWQRVVNAERRRPMHAGQQPAMQAAQQRAIGLERQLPESAEQQRPLLPSGQDTRSQHLQTEQRMDYEKHTSERKKADTGFWPHWKALIIITSSLVAGLSLALGHHFLYQSVQGRVVTDVSVSQAWMLRFGTAFAFLVNTAFAIGVAASYVQYQWLQLRSHNFKLEEIDSLTDVLKNALCFIYNFVFFKQPVLFLMATVAWTIPFAAVITPGSLTVKPTRNDTTIDSYVPQPFFNGSTPMAYASIEGSGWEATAELNKLVFGVAAAGQPLAIPSTAQNETYSLEFIGPALRCSSANESVIDHMSRNFGYGSNFTMGMTVFEYISWAGPPIPDRNIFRTTLSTLDEVDENIVSIFVMTNADYYWNRTIPVKYDIDGPGSRVIVVNVTECRLYNVTYKVDYAFKYPDQSSQVSILSWHNPVSADVYGPEHRYASSNYLGMMQALGKLLVGWTYWNQYGTTTSYTSRDLISIDWDKPSAVQAGLESLFQNMTLSLPSVDVFKKPRNVSERVPVTVTTYPITYAYAEWELLTAYGLAFLFSLLSAVFGFYALFINGDSYQNIFSSFVRATSGHEIHAMMDSDGSGADPLPRLLAKAKVKIGAPDGK